MATGTIARLSIALGLESSGILTGMVLAKKQMMSGMAGMQAEADAAGAHGKASLLSVGNVAIGVAATVATVGAGLVDLAVKYESETAAVGAAMGTTAEKARTITSTFVANAGKTIFTAQDVTSSFAEIAGQADLTAGHVLSAAEANTIMNASQNLAGASGKDLATSTAALAETMQAYSMPVTAAASASDVLFNVSKNLNEPIDAVATTVSRLHGALGPLAPSLKGTATLLEESATKGFDMTRNQRFLNQFITGVQHLTNANPDIAKLTTAQKELAAAQAKAAAVNAGLGTKEQGYTLDKQKLTVAQERLNLAIGKYGPATIQAGAAQVAVNSAQLKLNRDAGSANTSLAAAQAKVVAAQAKVDGLMGPSAGVLKQYNLHLFDAHHNFVGMQSVIEQLAPAFAKMTQQQQLAAATDLFGSKSATQMVPLIDAGAAGWNKYAGAVDKAGSASGGYKTATDNIASQWKTFVSGVQGIGTSLSVALEPFVKGSLAWLNDHLPSIKAGFVNAFNAAKTVVGDVWNVLHPMLQFLLDHWQFIVGLLALWVAKWVIMKALNIGKEIAGWTTALKDFASSGMGDALKKNALGPITDIKTAWSDMLNKPSDWHSSQYAKEIQKGMADTKALESEFATLRGAGSDVLSKMTSDLSTAPSDVSKLLSHLNMPKLSLLATVDSAGLQKSLLQAASDAANAMSQPIDSAIAKGMTSALTKEVPNMKAVWTTEFGGKGYWKAPAQSFANDIETAISDKVPTIAKDLSGAASGVGSTIANDVTTTLTKTGVLGKIAPVLGKFTALLAQPVWIVGANPGSLALSGAGGGNPLNPGNLLPAAGAAGGVETAVGLTGGAALAAAAAVAATTVLASWGVAQVINHLMGVNMTDLSPDQAIAKAKAAEAAWRKTQSWQTLQVSDQAWNNHMSSSDTSNMLSALQTITKKIGPLDQTQLTEFEKEWYAGARKVPAITGNLARLADQTNTAAGGATSVATAFTNSVAPSQGMSNGLLSLVPFWNAFPTTIVAALTPLEQAAAIAATLAKSKTGHGALAGLAGGGYIPPGGVAVVGEKEPELAFGGRTGQTIIPGLSRLGLQGSGAPQKTIHVGSITVNNPAPEPASESVQYQLRNLSMVGFTS